MDVYINIFKVISTTDFISIIHFSDVLIAAVLGLLGSACFLGSMDGMFIFDDVEAVVNNKDIQLDTHIHKVFENDFWGTKMSHNSSHKSYRPLTVLSFRYVYFHIFLNFS